MILPLGGLDWIMSLVRNNDLKPVALGTELLHHAMVYCISVTSVFAHPGVASGLVQARSHAASSQWKHIDTLWAIAVHFLPTRHQYLDDILGSDLLKSITTGCNQQPAPEPFLTRAVDAVVDLYIRVRPEAVTPVVALDCANAVISLYRQPLRNHSIIILVICQLLDNPNSTATNLLFEQPDIPDLYVCTIVTSTLSIRDRTDAFPTTTGIWGRAGSERHPGSSVELCACISGRLGSSWDLMSNADVYHLPLLLNAIVSMCFGEPMVLAAMAAPPPTRRWCTQLIESSVRVQPLMDQDVDLVLANLVKWCDRSDDMPAKLEVLHSSSDLVFVKSNLRLMMAVIDVLDPQLSGTGPSRLLVAYRQRVVDAVASTCPRYLASPSVHSESLCTQCNEQLLSFWD